ncbi:MAG: hypothetical protein Unbinned5350contig1004_28 [Prokaryotic dsDNA virus sp.]|nr:MAG: hypothetical protein Unbinned5350contig1004_28 [Prokaryotic dsDNA virus sp.]|tara:strand:+ start:2012 stop:2218 length:207 start_codon:yes stop_codon:yes gene_type:complete
MVTNLMSGDELINSVMNILDAETIPLKKQPDRNSKCGKEVREKQDDLEASRLMAATENSYYEDLFKSF